MQKCRFSLQLFAISEIDVNFVAHISLLLEDQLFCETKYVLDILLNLYNSVI